MSDLDQIAINDMKHELCDTNPCRECKPPTYKIEHGTYGFHVRIQEKHWSGAESYTLPQVFDTEQEARTYAEGWLGL